MFRDDAIEIRKARDTETGEIYKVEIWRDETADSPLDWEKWETRGIRLMDFTRHNLGDGGESDFKSQAEVEDWAKAEGWKLLPLYVLDHSGIWLSIYPFNDPWDSAKIGYAAYKPAIIGDNEGGAKKEVESFIKIFEAFLQGSVFGVAIWKGEEMFHCCGGFYYNEEYDETGTDNILAQFGEIYSDLKGLEYINE